MGLSRALAGRVAIVGALAAGVGAGGSVVAHAQTGVTTTVEQKAKVTAPSVPAKTPTVPSADKAPSAPTANTPSTPTVPSADKAPSAPSTGQTPSAPSTGKTPATSTPNAPNAPSTGKAPGASTPSTPSASSPGKTPTVQGKSPAASPGAKAPSASDRTKTGVDAPRRPGTPSAPRAPDAAGARRGGSGSGPAPDSGGTRREGGSGAARPGAGDTGGSGSPAAAARSTGSTRGSGGTFRRPPAGGVGATTAGLGGDWFARALDPRYERVFTRRLTDTVTELEGCLGRLPASDRRLLSLRAGLGRGASRSRADVARQLALTRQGVAVVEQGALRELLSVARSGACGERAVAVAGQSASGSTIAGAGTGGGWVMDRLGVASVPGGAGAVATGTSLAASAATAVRPALLDGSPFSRVTVAGPVSSAPAEGAPRVPGLDSWWRALLATLLAGLLALLLVLGLARRARRGPGLRTRSGHARTGPTARHS